MELVIDRLTKQYKNKIAVDRISIVLEKGVYGLLGANGAGKTTLMRMICGVQKPDSGTVTFDGVDAGDEAYRNILGYLPQDFGYYPEFTAFDFLVYLGSLKGLSKMQARRKSNEVLKLVALEEVAKKKIRTYSGGMKQRLGIAQSLLNNPKLLVLDEPTAGLDPKERVKFRNMISKLGEDRIVLLSTHIVSDVEHIAKTILVMKEGQLIHSGSLDEILQIVENKVYECVADEAAAAKLMEKYPVVNVRAENGSVFLRLIADEKPLETAQAITAVLEDLYLYYFSEVSLDV